MTATPSKALIDHVRVEEDILTAQWNYFVTLKDFEQELSKRVGSRQFIVANTVIWEAMLSKRDLLTIRFASWVRGMVEPGGFFGQVRAHHLNDVRTAWQAIPTSTDPGAAITAGYRRRRLEEMFPAAIARDRVDPEDIDALKDSTWNKLNPVVLDRDSFRAHPYDGEAKANARMVGLGEIEPLLRHAQELMNSFRLIADKSTLGYHVTIPTDLKTATQDLVDLLLFHGVRQLMLHTHANARLHEATGDYWWQLRERFLTELGRLGSEKPDLAVNDRSLIRAASEAMARPASSVP